MYLLVNSIGILIGSRHLHCTSVKYIFLVIFLLCSELIPGNISVSAQVTICGFMDETRIFLAEDKHFNLCTIFPVTINLNLSFVLCMWKHRREIILDNELKIYVWEWTSFPHHRERTDGPTHTKKSSYMEGKTEKKSFLIWAFGSSYSHWDNSNHKAIKNPFLPNLVGV